MSIRTCCRFKGAAPQAVEVEQFLKRLFYKPAVENYRVMSIRGRSAAEVQFSDIETKYADGEIIIQFKITTKEL